MTGGGTAAGATNPFIEYRHHLDLYHRARKRGVDDARYVDVVTEADERVAEVAGVGFRVTPMTTLDLDRLPPGVPDLGVPDPGIGPAPPVVAKVETGNVGGSHKARHLFGLYLRWLLDDIDRAGTGPGSGATSELAIASCGNAAVGAAIVAAAADRPLRVFVPTDADDRVLGLLDRYGARVETCPRQPGQSGDPCVHALDEALARGSSTAFTVQGPVCPAVIDGGRTLGLELAHQLDAAEVVPASIYVQIGGGALATAVMDGLERAWSAARLPRLHPVQADTAHPYVAGWRRIEPRLGAASGEGAAGAGLEGELAGLADLMTPWPTTPTSVASGILDDLTHDWRTVMAHQIRTGGWPIVVDEATFTLARKVAVATLDHGLAPPPDETGAAGLAGLLTHLRHDAGSVADGPAVVLLTGVART